MFAEEGGTNPWQKMASAPKDGRPVWAKGNNYGDPDQGQHFMWVYWDGQQWREPGGDEESIALYLTHWHPLPTT